MLNKKINTYIFFKISVLTIICYVFILTLIYGNDVNLKPINYILVLVFNILSILRVRKNVYYLIVLSLIFYFDYSIIYPNYIHHIDNFFTRPIDSSTTNISINILFIFSGMLYIVIPQNICQTHIGRTDLISERHLYKPIQYVVLLLLIAIIVFGISRPSEIGERSDPSPIYEYSVCIYIVALYYIHSKNIRKCLGFLCILSACQCFILGGRVSGIQNLMCLYLFFLSYRISFKRIVLYSSPLFIFMILIGSARETLLQGNFSVEAVLGNFIDSGGVLDTCYAAYQTSQIFTYAESRVANSFLYFLAFVGAVFLGSNKFPELNVQKLADSFFENYNGGIYPFYFYFFGGIISVILSSFIIYFYFKLMKSLTEKEKGLSKCLSIFFICHIFRWYLYTPYSLFRGSIFLMIIYCVFYFCSSKKTIIIKT